MYFQASVGINIESNRVSLVYLKSSLKGFFLAGQAIYSLEKDKPEEKTAEVRRLVNEFLKTHKILSADIFLGIQRDLAILRYIELPLAVKENLRGTLLYEMEKYVPLPVDDIYFDFQIVSEDKAEGKMTVLLVAVKKELIDPYLNYENRLGAGVSGIEINSTALANYFSCKPGAPNADAYAFLSLEKEYLELGFVKKKLLNYSRHLKIDKMGDTPQSLVSKQLEMLRKTFGSQQGRLEVISCGSDGSISDLLKETGDIHFTFPDLSKEGLSSNLLMPAYGLALKKIRKTPMEINLLPARLRKKVSKSPYYAMYLLIVLLVVAILGWGGSNILHQRRVSNDLESELKRLGKQVAVINQTKERLKELEHKVDMLNTLRQRHVPVLNVLQELTRQIPEGAWLERLAITDKKGDMEGYADSASALIPLLAASPLLKDVAFLSPITKGKDGKERFRIGFTVR